MQKSEKFSRDRSEAIRELKGEEKETEERPVITKIIGPEEVFVEGIIVFCGNLKRTTYFTSGSFEVEHIKNEKEDRINIVVDCKCGEKHTIFYVCIEEDK